MSVLIVHTLLSSDQRYLPQLLFWFRPNCKVRSAPNKVWKGPSSEFWMMHCTVAHVFHWDLIHCWNTSSVNSSEHSFLLLSVKLSTLVMLGRTIFAIWNDFHEAALHHNQDMWWQMFCLCLSCNQKWTFPVYSIQFTFLVDHIKLVLSMAAFVGLLNTHWLTLFNSGQHENLLLSYVNSPL